MNVEIKNQMILGIAEGDNAVITEKCAYAIGKAFAEWLMKKRGRRPDDIIIGVGIDSRNTGRTLKKQVLMGMFDAMVYIADCDRVSTPTLQTTITFPETRYDGACMISAGQAPAEYNGFRFFYKQGQLNDEELAEVIALASEIEANVTDDVLAAPVPEDDTRYSEMDMLSLYSAIMCMNICDSVAAKRYEYPLEGLHIIVDSGSGIGRFLANDILKELGAKTTGSLSLKPNGAFPDRTVDLSDDASLKALKDAVVKKKANLGIALDPDASNFSAVSADGEVIMKNEDINKAYKLIIDLAKNR